MQYLQAEVEAGQITAALSDILMDVSSATIVVSNIVNRNVIANLVVAPETINTHGEKQHRLDMQAHDIFVSHLQKGKRCNYLISEECEDTIDLCNDFCEDVIYTLCMDPLDGSSNIDVNISVGSIFSIYCQNRQSNGSLSPIKSGQEQRVAGYVIYGTSTMMVITYGAGVYGFTLDTVTGEFLLTHPNIRLNKSGSTYAINEGNSEDFPHQIRQFLTFCKQSDLENNLPYRSRYVGSMVADIHRTLLQGGIFLYPSTSTYPKGKLRLLYECNPMAYIIEQAGGLAIDGMRRIVDVPVHNVHQKVPFVVGSYNMVKKVLDLYKNESINNHIVYCC